MSHDSSSAAPSRAELLLQAFEGPEPELQPAHRALMRGLNVVWRAEGAGVPVINPQEPLAGDGPVAALAAALIGTADEALAQRRLAEVVRLLPRLLNEPPTCPPGRYAVPARMLAYLGEHAAELGVEDGHFELLPAHVRLMQFRGCLQDFRQGGRQIGDRE